MDELWLGKTLERLEVKLDRALDDQASARKAHYACQREVTGRLEKLEELHGPMTISDLWGWTWRIGAGTSAVVVAGAGAYEGARKIAQALGLG